MSLFREDFLEKNWTDGLDDAATIKLALKVRILQLSRYYHVASITMYFRIQASFPPPRVTRRRLPYMEVKEEWRKWDGQLTGNWTTENCRDVNFSRAGTKSFEM